MEGYMANVTPPNDRSEGVDGFASVDRKHHCASLVLGGKSVGDVNVVFQKMPDFLSGVVRVKVERVTWKSINTPVNGTDLISESDMVVEGGSLTVPVRIESELYGYRIYITPLNVPQTPYRNETASIPGRVEAENFDVAGQGFSYYDNDDRNKGDGEYRTDEGVDVVKAGDGFAIGYTEKGEWMEYTVDVKESDEYDIMANVSNGGEVDGFQLFLDGEALTQSYTIAQTSEDWSVYEEIRVATAHLEKGEHILKLLIEGNYVNIDWLEFKPSDPSAVRNTLGDEDKSLKGATYYDVRGNQVHRKELQRNKCYIAVPSTHKEGIKFVSE